MKLRSREQAAKVFEDWDLQAMHALTSGEVYTFYTTVLIDRVLLK